jgi:tetratricopeptide (TPR) repeat protein
MQTLLHDQNFSRLCQNARFVNLYRHRVCGLLLLVRALAIACVLVTCTASTQAQPSPASASRTEALRGLIKSAANQRATAEQLGTLWLQLANEYRSQFELPQAEDAFAHSLSLLRSPATQSAYADSLDGLGWLYFATSRPKEARKCLVKSLEIYQALGDRVRAAKAHESIAQILLFERRYRDGEAEASEGLKELQSQSQPDSREISAALIVHSYALCFQGRCNAALDDANLAMTLAQAVFPANSFEIAELWLARGFDQWKSGSPDEGERSMSEALRMLRNRTDVPPQLLAISQLDALRWYAACLNANHHKTEARQIKSEILQLQSEQHSASSSSTVSAAALAARPLVP